ncbi:transcription factor HIVEP2a [Corythoichthys intestinalis]|uniref:transcription factor HIVEP2a n=1 Tax=Corythoichthys intestinalis TaxID=161448 RepID=UPI0025A4E24D|nr:transcription factor HIVEP2a [Corythoichthys intestinalis]XP_057678066.1 transcription factor HIVEP2a [Corythoichthys intestinalis]XP_057678067.1 transcription factor HIVEP2a [Corythoichthys intestinalis]XP_057678068.1 transcription factor HIVEP2a [Corythoichthys intestinalis]XP_061806307.1 human immunodeficiency virus type I enhancer-binding protein 2 homolog [Nerophis lumbriciformis]
MEAPGESAGGRPYPNEETSPPRRKWASEPRARAGAFAEAPRRGYDPAGDSGKLPCPAPPDAAFQSFYSYRPGPPYPRHPETGARPRPGPEARAWPFAGQLPSDELYPAGHPGGRSGRSPRRQKSPGLPASFVPRSQSGLDPGDEGYGKKEQKAKKPGKYICYYCGRACAKPSVLKKHIRSHTGERPYPCVPCGFSFKTKSNLYKHRKSHAHAIKAGLAPFSEPAPRASPGGGAEVLSDGERSTDTDEEGAEGAAVPTDKEGAGAHVSFPAEKSPGGAEPAYADSAEELPPGSVKVPILIVPKSRGSECPPLQEAKGSRRAAMSPAGRKGRSLDDSFFIKPGPDRDGAATQSLNLLSPHGKGSTDSGYFSRSESAEQQISPPNTNVKTYEEIMFGRTWYYRPNSRSRHFVTVAKISEDPVCLRGDAGMSGDPKLYLTGPGLSGSGLLEPPSDSGPLVRSNSVPTSSPPNLSVPPGIRGSHSFDEAMTPDDVLYQPGLRRLQRQAAIELLAHEAHTGDAEGSGRAAKNLDSSLGRKVRERGTDRSPGSAESFAYGTYGAKVSLSEIATRKRRKQKSVGDEEDSPDHCDSSCGGSVEMAGDYVSLDGSRGTPAGKGSLQSAHSQSDSFETCPSMCSEDAAPFMDSECRAAAGNVISVIQHTNSLSRPNSFEKSESSEQPAYRPSGPSGQYSEQSDSDVFEDALSPESTERRRQSDGDPASLSSSSSPAQVYHVPHKLVRQPNIQVPEIRVTDEKDTEAPAVKEPEKPPPHADEFQLPQRSDTLSQMPSEKLPPKKKRLRLADMEHSSGESSFESTCTSLSRSPSQESNLSHSSSFSVSFDRDESLKMSSPTKPEEPGAKAPEFLTVPGAPHSGQHQQREMRRSSSEQAPYSLLSEMPEMRSKSFDYGSLSTSRQGELYTSASAMKERRRGFLVRQASLSVYPEAVAQEPGGSELLVKQESAEQGAWLGLTGTSHRSGNRTQRVGVVGVHQQHVLQQSISEDSLQDEPPYVRSLQHRLQTQGSSSDGEHPGHESINREAVPPFLSYRQSALFWSQELSQASRQRLTLQAQQQLQKLHIQSPNSLSGQAALRKQSPHEEKSEASSANPVVFRERELGASLVPVRVQTHVPSYGSVMYTSVSRLVAYGQRRSLVGQTSESLDGFPGTAGFNLSHFLGETDGTPSRPPHWKSSLSGPDTGIPLSLTSGTVSTTDASGSGAGGSKRMLSPASSLELFVETKQQKRVKEEKMFGQMLKEMSAVELSGTDKSEDGECGPPDNIAVPVRSSALHRPDVPRPESFTPPLQIVTDPSPVSRGRDSPEELDVDESRASPRSAVSSDESEDVGRPGDGSPSAADARRSPGISAGRTLLLADVADAQHLFRFPSLRTGSRVSWCFLNYTKPNSVEAEPLSSIYSSWCVSSYNPNPLNLSTKVALALLRSKQRSDTEFFYATAASAAAPSSGKLVSSVAWKLRFDQMKPGLMPLEISHFGRKMEDAASWARPKEERPDKDASVKPSAAAEPTRIKIFEGGYKSNEDYVYVRGRGRGKYICEECGIRCKKPSMLKKHIRTHTDVRPYVCKFCNFAFKTKGNLTKHMKSKAHLKKCLELGVSTSCADDAEADDADVGEEAAARRKTPSDHQFSDADDSEEDDDEDEEEEDEDGDSAPGTSSRSASPYGVPAAAPAPRPLFGYFTTVPSIRITAQASPGRRPPSPPSSSRDEDFPSPSSRLSSPGPDFSGCPSPASPCSSPSGRRYLSPRRDASPLGGCRRELSPRRGRLSLLAPLPRPVSPGKRDLSPRGRHKAAMRPNSPRRGLHQHLLLQSQQVGSRGLRSAHLAGLLSQAHPGRRRAAQMETEHVPGSPGVPEQGSPPHQVLFSHLPLHSQLQVRSPFPMIPIGGIQMVHAVPASLGAPRRAAEPRNPEPSAPAGEQEENVRTCTKAIASLRIDPGEGGERGSDDPEEGRSPAVSPPSSAPPGLQHFSASPHRPSPASSPLAETWKSAKTGGDVS